MALLLGVGSTAAVEVVPNHRYRLVRLGNLDCDSVPGDDGAASPFSVNRGVRAVGEGCADAGQGVYPHAFLWSREQGIEDLGTCDGGVGLTGDQSQVRWINDGTPGVAVAGFVTTTGLQDRRAFVWRDVAADCDVSQQEDCDFDDAPAGDCHVIVDEESAARAVNDSGLVVGWRRPFARDEAFVYASDEGWLCSLDDGGLDVAVATAINDAPSPLVGGSIGSASNVATTAAVWRLNAWQPVGGEDPCAVGAFDVDLLTLPLALAPIGNVWGVSDAGHVTGVLQYLEPIQARLQAFLFRDQDDDFELDPGESIVLTGTDQECTLSGDCAFGGTARAVDDAGQVVGSVLGDGELRGALWQCSWDEVEPGWSCAYRDVHDLFGESFGLSETERWQVDELWGTSEHGVLVGEARLLADGETVEAPAVALLPLRLIADDGSTLRVELADAGATVELYFACSDTTGFDPGAPCGLSAAGASLEIEVLGGGPARTELADADGGVTFDVAGLSCGETQRFFQALDRTSCVVSNVVAP